MLRDGPAGIGMMQRFVEHDPEEHYFTLLETHGDDFRRMAAFDIVINNTDRKGGHCLRAADGRIFGIDHGVSFHAQWKLRTVIWDFGGEPLPDGRVQRTCSASPNGSTAASSTRGSGRCSTASSSTRCGPRVEHLLATGVLPEADDDYHSYPWPMV